MVSVGIIEKKIFCCSEGRVFVHLEWTTRKGLEEVKGRKSTSSPKRGFLSFRFFPPNHNSPSIQKIFLLSLLFLVPWSTLSTESKLKRISLPWARRPFKEGELHLLPFPSLPALSPQF